MKNKRMKLSLRKMIQVFRRKTFVFMQNQMILQKDDIHFEC